MTTTIEKTFEKVCNGPTCRGEVRLAAEFYRNAARPDGLASQCKRCQSEYAGREDVRPRKNAATSRWQKQNPDKANAKVRRWLSEHPDRAHAIAKRYRDSDKGQATYESRMERYDIAAVAELVARLDALGARWSARAGAVDTAITETWAAMYQRLRNGYYRALRAGNDAVRINPADLLAYWEANGIDPTRCFYSGEVLEPDFQIDHKTPIARGGTHTLDNLVPCSAEVNKDKFDRTADEYLEVLNAQAA